MSMIKYYHEYILFNCYYSFKMVWEFLIVVYLLNLGLMLNF